VWLLNSIGTSRKFRSPLPVDAITAFNLPFDSLSTRYHNRMWLELGRIQSVRRESADSLFVPAPLSLSLSLSLSLFLFLSFAFYILLLCPGPPEVLWLCFPRENLSQGKDSLPRGIVIGSPGRFDLFIPRVRSTSHFEQARNRHVTHKSVIGKLTWLSLLY